MAQVINIETNKNKIKIKIMIKNEVNEAMSNNLTASQEFKYDLLKWCGKVDEAIASYDFIMTYGENNKQSNKQSDGIYFILPGDKKIHAKENPARLVVADCIGIGVKLGGMGLVVATEDEADGEDITLTSAKDTTTDGVYYPNYIDALSDLNGRQNTEHLKEIGLNSRIHIEGGWHIPSLGEMYFILLNLKAINQALEYAGKSQLKDDWYWTSTEASATNAWYLTLDDGNANYGTKASLQRYVRAVSAFI